MLWCWMDMQDLASSWVGYDVGQHVRDSDWEAQLQQPTWRRIVRQVLWISGMIVALAAVVFVINRFFVHRPLWDWLQLLIVPAVLAGGGLWFNTQQRVREQRIANERAQDEALQAYLDQMSDLLIPNKDRPSLYDEQPPDSLRSVARARTLTVLSRLEGERKGKVLHFLYESGLIRKDRHVLDLSGADLSGADLSSEMADLSSEMADLLRSRPDLLSGAQLGRLTDLSGANLAEAHLRSATLGMAFLKDADLSSADLRGADLRWADLRGATLEIANLIKADLSRAYLEDADLRGADLRAANLSMAMGRTNEELAMLAYTALSGATMPNGQKYEDWLKDR